MDFFTEEELKAYFDYLIKKYPNSPAGEHYQMMKSTMFDPLFESDGLKYFIKNFKKEREEN